MKPPVPFEHPVYYTQPLLPDLEQYKSILQRAWDARWLTNMGELHNEFEKRVAETLKVPAVSVFNNGTIALITAVQSLRLSGEVITTPFTFPATPHVLSWNGINPIFCDIDSKTLNLDPARIESLITSRTTGILAVHVFGTPCDTESIQKIADTYGLKVIYDAAHAFGVEIDGRGIGTFGDISMFSFHATKLFHTAEGGALTYKDSALKTRVDLLKNFGIKNEEQVVMPGINGKMTELQAGLGLLVLDMIEEERRKRSLIEMVYRSRLENVEGISMLPALPNVRQSYQYFVIRVYEKSFGIRRNTLHARLKDYNVICRKYFYPLCSDYSCYNQLPSASSKNLPVANDAVQEVMCLPFYGDLGIEKAQRICDMIKYIKFDAPDWR